MTCPFFIGWLAVLGCVSAIVSRWLASFHPSLSAIKRHERWLMPFDCPSPWRGEDLELLIINHSTANCNSYRFDVILNIPNGISAH